MYIIHICSQFSDSVKAFVFVFLSYIFKIFSIKSLAVCLLVVALKAYISKYCRTDFDCNSKNIL